MTVQPQIAMATNYLMLTICGIQETNVGSGEIDFMGAQFFLLCFISLLHLSCTALRRCNLSTHD